MKCPFCFSPFNGKRSDLDRWKAIIDTIAQWGVSNVTFGGGDPYGHAGFCELLAHSRSALGTRAFIQVDTNGLALRKPIELELFANVDLLALPLDGYSKPMHQAMRHSPRHYEHVLWLLVQLSQNTISLKVNTVLCTINIATIDNLLSLLSRYRIAIWSIYEFWEIQGTRSVTFAKRIQSLPHRLFLATASRMKAACDFSSVEIGAVKERFGGYFFVDQTGQAYAHARRNPHKYIPMGSIFNSSTQRLWSKLAETHSESKRIEDRIHSVHRNHYYSHKK